MSDTNYRPLDFANVHGLPDNPIKVEVIRLADGYFITGHPDPAFNGWKPLPEGVWSDTIKFSNSSFIHVRVHGRLTGGREDCVDINNGSHDIRVEAEEWESGGLFVATVKGGSWNIMLVGKIVKHGRETDIDLGNWSDQNRERTRNVCLSLTCDDAIKVRVLNAWEPVIFYDDPDRAPQAYDINDRWKGIFLQVFIILKRLHLVN